MLNWDKQVEKLEKILNQWKKRNLTLFGKVLVIKSLALSKLMYNANVLAIPENIVKNINSIIYRYLWNSKRDKIARKPLIGNYEEGGIQMCDVESLFQSLKNKWAIRLIFGEEANWKLIPQGILTTNFGGIEYAFSMNTDTHTIKKRKLKKKA